MGFDDRLLHTLVIERATPGAVDEYNQPTQTWAEVSEVPGLVQPKTVRELAQLNQGGPVVSTHTIFLRPTDLQEADRIVANGSTYQVTGVRDPAGIGHHYEVDAKLVGA